MFKLITVGIPVSSVSLTGAARLMSVLDVQQAIAAADSSKRSYDGRFVMTVRATGKVRGATYINSSDDYRASDNVTFRLAPNVDRALTKRYNSPVEQFLTGKRLTLEALSSVA